MSNVGVNLSSTSPTHEESDELKRSKRAGVVKNFGRILSTYNIEDGPVTFKDAITYLEAKTWVLVDLPLECTTIGCKWIFKKKLKPDGTADKLKVRLVAKGFKQKDGIDYLDIYSLVARLTIIWVLIALALVYNLPIHRMDVTTTFLYGELDEEIYTDQFEEFVAHDDERKVCKLIKSL
ncbi:UNVERIFIED_CONTAM: Retrovirus-related Pol polyprotein from transposon TNT 1-94 [Sesamum calycinum]|uniref:Retrovirus-related Pol polyprotein from transposon TNT 1-94 n=1 Tax=Sesamum calycinum TaxID=2727403 RepID=A0AAW2N1V9_9LAMI